MKGMFLTGNLFISVTATLFDVHFWFHFLFGVSALWHSPVILNDRELTVYLQILKIKEPCWCTLVRNLWSKTTSVVCSRKWEVAYNRKSERLITEPWLQGIWGKQAMMDIWQVYSIFHFSNIPKPSQPLKQQTGTQEDTPGSLSLSFWQKHNISQDCHTNRGDFLL